MLPTFGENYTAIHDLPMVQVLLLECGSSVALISVDTVIISIREQLLDTAEKELGIDRDRILLHAAHVLSTPHFRAWSTPTEWAADPAHRGKPVSKDDAEKYCAGENLMCQAHIDAVAEACRQAKKTLRPAKYGIGTARAPITVNRVVETADGWRQGTNPNGPSDPFVPVLRLDDDQGGTIALVYNCNAAPGCMEFSTGADGGRLVSGDLAAASERFIDREFGGDVVSIYTTGFTGNQWLALRARQDHMDRKGNQVITDIHEAGFHLVDILAARLGEQVVHTADRIVTSPLEGEIGLDRYRFIYPGQRVSEQPENGPAGGCVYLDGEPQTVEVKILQIGDTAVIACGVEICYATAMRIKKESPFQHTLFWEFTTDGFGYLPEAIFYERMAFQARKSRFANGGAERFATDVLAALNASFQEHRRKNRH